MRGNPMYDLFSPVFTTLYNAGKPTTNKQIAEETGINEHRVGLLKKHPERATLAEIEVLAEVFGCCYRIGEK